MGSCLTAKVSNNLTASGTWSVSYLNTSFINNYLESKGKGSLSYFLNSGKSKLKLNFQIYL